MPIEQLEDDLRDVVSRIPSGPLISSDTVAKYLREELVPFVGSLVKELVEMDATIEELYLSSEDVLHESTAKVFAGLIAGGAVITQKLLERSGSDPQIAAMANEWRELAKKGTKILTEITIPDPEPEDEAQDQTEPEGASA